MVFPTCNDNFMLAFMCIQLVNMIFPKWLERTNTPSAWRTHRLALIGYWKANRVKDECSQCNNNETIDRWLFLLSPESTACYLKCFSFFNLRDLLTFISLRLATFFETFSWATFLFHFTGIQLGVLESARIFHTVGQQRLGTNTRLVSTTWLLLVICIKSNLFHPDTSQPLGTCDLTKPRSVIYDPLLKNESDCEFTCGVRDSEVSIKGQEETERDWNTEKENERQDDAKEHMENRW